MKIRTDFVTNSSSSSFVCIRIQSEKLKELFETHNFNAFSSDDKYNIVIKEEDEIGTNDVDSIEGILSVLIEDLEMYCKDDLIKEINNNYDDIINNIEYADYKYSSVGWDEFEDEEDDEVYYVYEKEPNQNNAMIEVDNINFSSQEEMINAINEGEEDGVCLCAVDFGFYRPDFEESESSITTEAMINIRKLDDGNIRVLLMYLDAESEDLQRIQTCVSEYEESQEDDHDSSVLCVAIYPIKFSGSAWVAGYNPITFEIVRQDMSAAGLPIEAGVVVMEFMCHDDLNSVPNFLFNVVPDDSEEAITLLSKPIESDEIVYDSNEFKVEGKTLEKYLGNDKHVEIPNGIKTIGNSAFVKKIGDIEFDQNNQITTVVIPNSVTTIGEHAFFHCKNLKSITIPNSVTTIERYAFAICDSLESITIPDSVSSIGSDAFNCCKSLTSVTLPKGLTSIDEGVFSYCISLTSIEIPNTVTTIGSGAFSECENLKSVTIPDSVTSLQDYVFEVCHKLEEVIIPDSVVSMGEYVFSNCKGLKTISIPKSVVAIGNYAFDSCGDLTVQVKYDSYALDYCKKNGVKHEIIYTPEELEKENNEKYNNAIKDMKFGKYSRALSALESIASFKDAEQKIVECKFQMESSYDKAKKDMSEAKDEAEFRKIAICFRDLIGYEDAKKLADECTRKADELKNDELLCFAEKEMAKKKVSAYKAAKRSLNLIRGWKDADEKYLECERKIKEHTKLLKKKTKILKELDDSTQNQNELERQQKSNKEGKTYFFLGLLFTTFFTIIGFALSGFFILFAIFTAIGGILNVKSFSEYSEIEHKLTEQKERTDRLRAEFNEISNKIYQLENGYDEV